MSAQYLGPCGGRSKRLLRRAGGVSLGFDDGVGCRGGRLAAGAGPRRDGVLVGDAEVLETFEGLLEAFALRDLKGVKAATFHKGNLVSEDVPGSAKLAGESPAAQKPSRAEAAAVTVDGEIDGDQIDRFQCVENFRGKNIIRDFDAESTGPLRESFVLLAKTVEGNDDISVRDRIFGCEGAKVVFDDGAISNDGHLETRPRRRLPGRVFRPPDGRFR